MITINIPEATAVTDWLSVCISLAALVGAVISTLLTRSAVKSQDRHNKLSLRPLPRIAVGDYLERLYVKIVNDGPGPMIIQSVRVYDSKISYRNLLESLWMIPKDVVFEDFTVEIEGRSVRSNDEIVLVAIKGDPRNDDFANIRNNIRKSLSDITIEIEYSDVYRSKSEICVRNLAWFGRE